MEQNPIVHNEASASNVDKTEVQKHPISVSTADSKEAVKNDQEFWSVHTGSDSSLPDPYAVFTRDGTVFRLREDNAEFISAKKKFISGMGLAAGETTVVAMNEYPDSNLTQRARVEAYQAFLANKYGGNDQNACPRLAMYGSSKAEIAHILEFGIL